MIYFFLSALSAYLGVLCGSMIYMFNHKEHKVQHEGHKGLFRQPQTYLFTNQIIMVIFDIKIFLRLTAMGLGGRAVERSNVG